MKNYIILMLALFPGFLMAQSTLHITSGGTVVGGGGNLILNNSKLVNDGTFVPGTTTVRITGTAADAESSIGGTSTTTVHNLIIDKSANNARLEQEVSVANTLTLSSGNLDVQASDLIILPGGGVSGGSAASYVRTSGAGKLVQQVGGASVVFPVGNSSYNPATLSNAGAADNISIRVTDEVLDGGTSGAEILVNAVNRTWMIDEEVAGGSNIDLTLQWAGSEELSGFIRSGCYVAHYDAGTWDMGAEAAASGTDPYTRTRTGITTLSPFAVSSAATLPVELLSFDAHKQGQTALLKWKTANEINNNGFYVERSGDGNTFERLGFVEGAGNSNEELDYDFTDTRPLLGMNYYRLKQEDFDGTYAYTEIRSLYFGKQHDIVLYPNPASKGTVIHLNGLPESDGLRFQVQGVLGRLLLDKTLPNATSAELWLWQLPAATYIYTVKDGGETISSGRLIIAE